MVIGVAMIGSSESGVIVCTPAPGMAKAIVSGPGLALASSIAWRSEPGPVSSVFVTVKVAPETPAGARRRGRPGMRFEVSVSK